MPSLKSHLRWVSVVACVATAALLLTACGSSTTSKSATSTKTPHTVDFANFSDSGALFVSLQHGLQTAATEAGVTLNVYNNNASEATTLSNAHTMVLDKPSAILEYDPVASTGARIGSLFTSAHIPCVAVNIPFPGCAWFNQSDSILASQLAKVMSNLMATRGWNGTNTIAVLLESAAAGPAVNVAVWDDYADLAKVVPHMAQKAASTFSAQTTTIGSTGLQVNAGNSLATAYTAMKNALQTIPSSRHIVVFSVDDDMTLGAYRALQNTGRSGNAMITGFGGDPQAIEALRSNPAWVADESSFFANWGQYLLALATAVAEGIRPPHLTVSPEVILTKKNVNTYFPAGTTAAPKMLPALAPQDKFLLKTGVLQKFHDILGLS